MFQRQFDPEVFRSTVLAMILSVSIASFGCGDAATNDDRAQTSNGNSSLTIANTPAPAANTSLPTSNAVNTAIPSSANATQPKGFPGPQTQPRMATQNAPDDSEVSVVLNENIIRTRVFKSHPTLLKIEESTIPASSSNKSIKVYLKNGSVRQIPAAKIGDPMSESAANILAAIGSN